MAYSKSYRRKRKYRTEARVFEYILLACACTAFLIR